MSDNGDNLPMTGDMQVLVRDLVERRLALLGRRAFIAALILLVLLLGIGVALTHAIRVKTIDTALRQFERSTNETVVGIDTELNQLRSLTSQDAQLRQAELERLLLDNEQRLTETRIALSEALSELNSWRTKSSDVIAEARARVADAERLAQQAHESLVEAARLAEQAVRDSADAQEQINLLYPTVMAADAKLTAQDVTNLVEGLAMREDFQLAIIAKLNSETHRPLRILGDIRILGSLQVSNPIDNGVSTTFLPGVVKFAGTDGGRLLARSIQIGGGSHDQGVLRVLDRHARDAVLITCDDTLSDAPNSGRIIVSGDPKVTKYRAGIFLGTDKKYKFAISEKDGEFR